jgi:hypothetical protein
VASVTENETYIGNRLQFQDGVNEDFSGVVQGGDVSKIFRRARVLALAAGFLVLLIQLLSSDWDHFPDNLVEDVSWTPVVVVAVLVFVAVLLVPHRDPLSEWQLMLDGKAASADSAYAAIYGTLRTRQMPVSVTTRRFRTAGDPSVNNFLVVGDAHVYVYVSVFAYGTSLYLGWTMWRRRLPVVLLYRWFVDTVGGMFGRHSEFAGQLASNRDRALREAVHSAVREGIDAVNYGVDVPVAATFGYEVPVETLGAPTAGPASMAPQPPYAAPAQAPYAAPAPRAPMPAAPMAAPAAPAAPVPPAAPFAQPAPWPQAATTAQFPPVPPVPPVGSAR